MTTMYALADSVGNNAGVNSWPYPLATRLGWTPTVEAQAGSGYLHAELSFRSRLPALLAAAPDVVMVEGGANDVWYTLAALTTEIGLFFAALRAGLPDATVYAIAPWNYGGAGIGTSKADIGAIIEAAVLGIGGGYLDWLTDPWVNPANEAIYVADAHPNVAGHAYLGDRLAHAITYPFGNGFVAGIVDDGGNGITLGFQS